MTCAARYENGKLRVDQGVIAGCAGGLYDNICEAAAILKGTSTGGCGEFYALSVYPGQPADHDGTGAHRSPSHDLMASRCHRPHRVLRPLLRRRRRAPANNALSIRHTTRNFPNREGSKPGNGQLVRRGTDGCPLHRGHRGQRRHSDPGYRYGLWIPTVPEYQYDP